MHPNWPLSFWTHLSMTRHHYPPTDPLQTTLILRHLELDQDVACSVDLTSNLCCGLFNLHADLVFLSCCVNCSSPLFLHPRTLSGNHARWQRAHPGWGIFCHHHLLRLRRDHLGVQERRCTILPSGPRSKWWSKLQNCAKEQRNQCSDVVERELETHWGLSVQRSVHKGI